MSTLTPVSSNQCNQYGTNGNFRRFEGNKILKHKMNLIIINAGVCVCVCFDRTITHGIPSESEQ